ncbi:hypothetical protein HZH68_015039 [Vespula germanica]|uniref:Uncharacterized protein n=2 Tax=Vespula TaxID=7451 RepID=A0A834MS54_VESGE|nr:hypothetical protein HZH68_015039 [Vespula germanica]KAF7398276.1 hypothetical protein H0235_016284 [Vespula pensylvanica]
MGFVVERGRVKQGGEELLASMKVTRLRHQELLFTDSEGIAARGAQEGLADLAEIMVLYTPVMRSIVFDALEHSTAVELSLDALIVLNVLLVVTSPDVLFVFN